jgi:hypothetical protein
MNRQPFDERRSDVRTRYLTRVLGFLSILYASLITAAFMADSSFSNWEGHDIQTCVSPQDTQQRQQEPWADTHLRLGAVQVRVQALLQVPIRLLDLALLEVEVLWAARHRTRAPRQIRTECHH